MSQFNDSEYKRWSDGITRSQSSKTQSGIESFLGMSETLQTECEDTLKISIAIAEK